MVPATTNSAAPSSIDVKLLERKHELWTLHRDQRQTLELLYEGGIRLKNNGSNLLMKRPKELYDVYQERYRRLTHEPLLGNCVRWYVSKLFQSEPKIDGKTEDKRWSGFLQDCDRSGTTFLQFARRVIEKMLIFQVAYVLIDKPGPNEDRPVLTRADEQSQGLDRPYLVLYEPRQVINWSSDEYGNLEWIVIKLLTETQDGPLAPKQQSVHWYIFDRTTFKHYRFDLKQTIDDVSPIFNGQTDEWAGVDAKAELVDGPRPHALTKYKRVPVRVCEFPEELNFANATYLQLCEHLDFHNAYSWKLLSSCFPQLVIFSEKELTGKTLSETGFLLLDSKDRIEWLEPKGDTYKECRNYMDMTREEIYRSWNLQAQGRSSSATADGASGYSKEMEMAPAVDILNAIGDQARADQQNILIDYMAAAGLPVDLEHQPDVNGYRFETKPALQQIGTAQAVIDLGLTDKSPTLEKTLDKEVAIPLLDGQNEDIKAKVMAELDAAPTRKEAKDAEEQAQQQSFDQRFQRSVATNVLKGESDSTE